jgi:hypothetical protein
MRGKPTTISSARENGVTKIRVWCEHRVCLHSEVVDITPLGLSDDLPVVKSPRYRNFVCTRCGNRKVSVRFEYPPAPGTWTPGR